MNDNIIDKSAFFRRRAKPTEAENEERQVYLISLLCKTLEDLLMGDFSHEQRVFVATHIVDFAFEQVSRQRGPA